MNQDHGKADGATPDLAVTQDIYGYVEFVVYDTFFECEWGCFWYDSYGNAIDPETATGKTFLHLIWDSIPFDEQRSQGISHLYSHGIKVSEMPSAAWWDTVCKHLRRIVERDYANSSTGILRLPPLNYPQITRHASQQGIFGPIEYANLRWIKENYVYTKVTSVECVATRHDEAMASEEVEA